MVLKEPDAGNCILELVQTSVPEADARGNENVMEVTENGWKNLIFARIETRSGTAPNSFNNINRYNNCVLHYLLFSLNLFLVGKSYITHDFNLSHFSLFSLSIQITSSIQTALLSRLIDVVRCRGTYGCLFGSEPSQVNLDWLPGPTMPNQSQFSVLISSKPTCVCFAALLVRLRDKISVIR